MRNIFFVCLFMLGCNAASAQENDSLKPGNKTVPAIPVKITSVPKKNHDRINPYLVDTLINPIPLAREMFHDKVDKEQIKIDAADGFTDHKISLTASKAQSALLNNALLTSIDRLQTMIENMPADGRDAERNNQQKILCLRALWELLRQYSADPRPDGGFYHNLVENMHDMIVASNEHKSLEFTIANPGIYTLDNSKVLFDNQPEARAYVYSWMGRADPVLMVKRLEEFAKDTFAGTIISAAARQEPKLIFNYTLSSNILLKGAVYHTHDPFVQAIVQTTAESEAPLKALPFLSYLFNGKKTIEEIDKIAADPSQTVKHLVALRVENEPLTKQIYTGELEYNTLKYFVRPMNELHDTTDDVRFRCIDSLSPQTLYYIIVFGREEIYTSSFLGTFKRMMERMPPVTGDQFLETVHHDQFRAFIRLCAGYNTLSEFLKSMNESARSVLMSRFIGGLQNGAEDDLEDAVNVADAFGSIKDSALFVFLDAKVKENYKSCVASKNKKGTAIYSLLSTLISGNQISGTDTGAATASALLHLPPVNIVPNTLIANDTGTIYERVFFYGDEDGKTAYDGFMDDYRRNPKWKTDTTNKYWATVSSLTGKHITMYANRPLQAPLDEKAIDSLDQFLFASGINPTVVIHRGHSYHVKTTLSKLDTNAKIVVLGSCGGYHNVATVLAKSPDAHIISSKQTGVGAINEPIVRAINAQLLESKDINWISTWQGLDEYFVKKKELYERFNDYIPPHKNLGVIFIKSYRQMMAQ